MILYNYYEKLVIHSTRVISLGACQVVCSLFIAGASGLAARLHDELDTEYRLLDNIAATRASR
tara:strand:+ start:503 stop:691 length:189 start_codon:yes stop_codon:yes gene_type:complete